MKSNNFVRKLLLLALIFVGSAASAFALSITKEKGWLESVCAEWLPVENAARYEVFVSDGNGLSEKLDDHLIRRYADHFRADAVGLTAGMYTLTVKALDNNGQEMETATTTPLEAKAQIREGFAFTADNVPGAYTKEGNLKDGATVLYVTDTNINTITCKVKDKKGVATEYTGLGAILEAFGKGYDKTPLCVRMIGQIYAENFTGIKDGNYLNLQGSNKTDRRLQGVTVEGIGDDASLYGFGITMKRTLNIEIKNLGIMLFGDDAVSLDTDNSHIWIHNVDFFYGKPGSDADQVKGDGSIDIKYRSTDISIAFNHFFDSGKVMGCGGATGEDENLRITFHHNWFDHADSRCPRLHYVTAHIYNNYYDGVSVYGMGNTSESSAFVEGNYFREVKRPMMISGQGTDKYDETSGTYSLKGTFSGQNGGMTKAFNNMFINERTKLKLVYQTDNATQFDAYLVSKREETVPDSVKSVTGSWSYNNFDTAADMYECTPDEPEQIPDLVSSMAGRMDGGDLKWQFDNATDDENHDVNTSLKAAIQSYKCSFVGFQDDSTDGISQVRSANSNDKQQVFNLCGQKTNNARNGIFIVKGNRTRKVAVK